MSDTYLSDLLRLRIPAVILLEEAKYPHSNIIVDKTPA